MTDVHYIEAYRPPRRRVRSWWLEFDCDGVPYTWRGNAPSEAAAEQDARHQLAHLHESFNRTTARMTACLER